MPEVSLHEAKNEKEDYSVYFTDARRTNRSEEEVVWDSDPEE